MIKYNTQTTNSVFLNISNYSYKCLVFVKLKLLIEKFVIQNYIVVFTFKAINVSCNKINTKYTVLRA